MERLSSGCENKLKIIIEKMDKKNNILEIRDNLLGTSSNDLNEYFGEYWNNGSDLSDFKYLEEEGYISCEKYSENPTKYYKIKLLQKGNTYFEKIKNYEMGKKEERKFTLKTLCISNIFTFILGVLASIIVTLIMG